jgi:hypothetical protein
MNKLRSESGVLLVGALVVLSFFMVLALSVSSFSLNHYLSSKRSLITLNALDVAEAGGEHFMYHINADNSYAGTSGPVTLYNDAIKGRGTFETTVVDGTITNEKIITSTGKIYLPQSATTPKVTRTIKLVIEGSNPNAYTLYGGPGGLILGNNVNITNGQVFANGYIVMNNNSTIGSVSNPSQVFVGNYQCPGTNPPGATYPALCAAGTMAPITFNNGSHIYGTVKINNGASSSFMTHPGYTAGAVSATTLPNYDRAGTKATINTTMTAANASSCASPHNTWNNVHITGNVTLPNNCTITVNGNVWIDGNLVTGNNNFLRVGSSVTSSPQIMIDGSGGLNLDNGGSLSANAGGIGFYVVTFWNATGDPDATGLTGNDLYNSMYIANDRSTPRYTIRTGSNASAASGSTLFARWSGINMTNNGSMGQLIGQLITLANNGTVAFNGGATGGPLTWDVRYYQQIFP